MDGEKKLQTIYSYVVEHTFYDSRYYQAPNTLPYESRAAYGTLEYGNAICSGRFWAFNMLCEEAGIPCWNITGMGLGEDYMWNCALIRGEYRYFDTTWDAEAVVSEQWRYFACTEEEIALDHQCQEALIHALTLSKCRTA